MKKINFLETKPATRYDELDPNQDGNKNTRFADLIIDGRSIYQMFKKHDLVPSLGWGSEANQKLMIDYFLLREQHEYMYNRYPILVCPWCGDEDCGFISVFIERKEDIVIWKDFMKDHDNKTIPLGPFYFKWDNYKQVIDSTFGTAGIQ